MAKNSRGGKRAGMGLGGGGGGISLSNNQPVQPVQQVQPAQTISSDYNSFVNMTDDEKADVISSMISQSVPAHLSDNDFQKFIYNIGLNDKPQLVDDATLDGMAGTEIFRTVNSVYDRKNDISYNADQICKQVQSGRITRVSDSGGSVYGKGIYFADNLRDSTDYGNSSGNVKKTAVIRGKLNSNAKVINYHSALSAASKEANSGSKLGNALKKCDSESMVSLYALAKGYNVITNGRNYYNILNRNAVTISKTINPK